MQYIIKKELLLICNMGGYVIRKVNLTAFSLVNKKIIYYSEKKKLEIKLNPETDELIINKKNKKINF